MVSIQPVDRWAFQTRDGRRAGCGNVGQAQELSGFIARRKLVGQRPIGRQEEADARAQETTENHHAAHVLHQ